MTALSDQPDPAVTLGYELRRGRQGCRKRQRDVAAEIGGSQSMVSRMELGRGAAMSLATWAAAAQAVDRRLVVDIVGSTRNALADPQGSLARRCHRSIADAARSGGWSAVTEIQSRSGRDDVETILVRHDRFRSDRHELAVVRVWDVVTNISGSIDVMRASLERERRDHDDGWAVGGLVVVPSGPGNRRRMTEERAVLESEFPAFAARWYAALRNDRRAMPGKPGMLWTDRRGGRILPAPLVPGWIWVSPGHGPAFAFGR